MTRLTATVLAVLGWLAPGIALAQTPEPLLVVLAPTGEVRDGLPVLARHPGDAPYLRVLGRGYSGRMLDWYAAVQHYLHATEGRAPEPAYLALTSQTGGFPRTGFVLDDVAKPQAGWVDLRRSSTLSGRFGAMDQIFPHELWHVMAFQLAGPPRRGGSTQVHALGVRTDPITAFHEGLATHAQVMAVDDPGAMPETAALRDDVSLASRAFADVEAFGHDLRRGWPVQPQRLRFLFWFSSAEQVLRYHAVKANRLAREPQVPPGLLLAPDPYPAYLWASVTMPPLDGPWRRPAVAWSIDGPVAYVTWRLATDPRLQQRYLSEDFYRAFGRSPADVDPVDNAAFKMFAVLHRHRPESLASFLRGWMAEFPEDASDVSRIAGEAAGGQAWDVAPEVWLAGERLITGASLFDQYRGMPRLHTFDANAATSLDWLSIAGLTPEHASHMLASGPFASLDEVLAVAPAAISPAIADAAERMRTARDGPGVPLGIGTILGGYLWRLLWVVLAGALPGAVLARLGGVRRWWTAGVMALAATLLVIGGTWVVISPPWFPVALPVIAGGVPWALWQVARSRPQAAARALLCWALASLPALLITWTA